MTAGEETLEGTVSAIDPTIRNGVLTFTRVARRQVARRCCGRTCGSTWTCSPSARRRALRVARGPFATGEGAQNVFVLHGAFAERRRLRLGAASPTHFEVLEGLREGDEVIVSDMTDYLHAARLRVR